MVCLTKPPPRVSEFRPSVVSYDSCVYTEAMNLRLLTSGLRCKCEHVQL